jgi:hypothetical protein
VRRETGSPASHAVASVQSSTRVAGARTVEPADTHARLVLTGLGAGDHLVRVTEDDNRDGIIDRGAYITTARLERAAFPRLFGNDVEQLTSALFDDVELRATVGLRGEVSGCDEGLCRVFVTRELQLGPLGDTRTVHTTTEATAIVNSDGSFLLQGLIPGPVRVVALRWTPANSDVPRQQAIAAARDVDRFATATVVVGTTESVTLALGEAPADVEVDIEVGGATGDPTRQSGSAVFFVPGTTTDVIPNQVAIVDGVNPDTKTFRARVPLGVFDLSIQLDDGDGFVFGVVAAPGLSRLGPVEIGPLVVCPQIDGANDCDNDGVPEGEDEDDDGDGQPDADESIACLGPGKGTDYDRDCLCEPYDPVPSCTSNDPAACDVAPPSCD